MRKRRTYLKVEYRLLHQPPLGCGGESTSMDRLIRGEWVAGWRKPDEPEIVLDKDLLATPRERMDFLSRWPEICFLPKVSCRSESSKY